MGDVLVLVKSFEDQLDKCRFPVESQVALKGGSVVMTVIAEHRPVKLGGTWDVSCAWHDDVGSPQETVYPVAALQDATEEYIPKSPKPTRKPRRDVSRWANRGRAKRKRS